MSDKPVEAKVMTLNVMYVGEGGNAGRGEYYYSCVPNIVNVTEEETPLEFHLSEDTAKRFELSYLFCNDIYDQISPSELTFDGKVLSVIHQNKMQSLTVFSAVLIDKTRTAQNDGKDYRINCDPQATNVPPPN